MKSNILYDAGGEGGGEGGGGGAPPANTPPADWRAGIPEDLRTNPSLASFKDVGSLAKSYIHANSLIGAEKIAKPLPSWQQAQWDAFWSQVGRPETHDKYAIDPKIIPEGITVDDAKMAKTKEMLYAAGLTNAQANKVLGHYFNSLGETSKELTNKQEAARQQAVDALTKEWGAELSSNMDIARAVIQKFATPELTALLEDSKWGDNPAMVKFFHKVGLAMMEDRAGSGEGALILSDSTSAVNELKTLKGDQDFLNVLLNRQHPGHKEAKERWDRLHKIAHPDKPSA
jgi:hypothetical protein